MSMLRRSALSLLLPVLASAFRESFQSLEVAGATTRVEEMRHEVADDVKGTAGGLFPVKTGVQVGGALNSRIHGDAKVSVGLRKVQAKHPELLTDVYFTAKSDAAAETFAGLLQGLLDELQVPGPPKASARGATVVLDGVPTSLHPSHLRDLQEISEHVGHLTLSLEANMDDESPAEANMGDEAKQPYLSVNAFRADLEGTLTPKFEQSVLAYIDGMERPGLAPWLDVARTVVSALGKTFSGLFGELRLGAHQGTIADIRKRYLIDSTMEAILQSLRESAELLESHAPKTFAEVVRAAAQDLEGIQSVILKGLPASLEAEVAFTNVKPFHFLETLLSK